MKTLGLHSLAQLLAQRGEVDAAAFTQGHADLAVVGAAHEQQHVVHAVVGSLLPREAHRDVHVARPCLFLDRLQATHPRLARQFVIRTRRRAVAQHEFAGIDLRKQLGPESHAHQPQDQPAHHEIDRHHHPAQADAAANQPAEDSLHMREQAFVFLFAVTAMVLQQPN